MTRAVRPERASSARVVAILMLAVGVSVSACSGNDTPAGGDHDSHAASTSRPQPSGAAVDGEVETHDHAEDHDEKTGEATGHDHDHDQADTAAVTTGPPRPADPDVGCGATVLGTGEQITRYCGDGNARFVITDEKDSEVEGALCEDRGALFLAHFGTNYSDDATARGDYLGLALEEMPAGDGVASIYALELTLDGYRQALSDATVEVTRDGQTLGVHLVGELADGTDLTVEGSCTPADR